MKNLFFVYFDLIEKFERFLFTGICFIEKTLNLLRDRRIQELRKNLKLLY